MRALLYLFVGGLINNKGRIISIFTKREPFLISFNNQVLFGLISRCSSRSCTLQKRSSSPLQFGQEENIPGHSIGRGAYWFVLRTALVFFIPTGKIERWRWTLSKSLISPLYKINGLEDKSMWAFSEKGLPSPFSLAKKPGLYLQQAENNLAIKATIFLSKNCQKILFGKMNCYICFFIGVAIKTAVSVSWSTTLVSLC